MKMITKAKIWISWLLCALLALSCSFVGCAKLEGNVNNLIYVIGDGMGFNHIENAKLYMEVDELSFEKYYVGEVSTCSADSSVTDSAAAATALATGVKTKNNYVGFAPDASLLTNIMEISKEKGKKTGVVTTDALSGATPAGFSAHAYNRNSVYDIIAEQQKGKVDLLIGEYSSTYGSERDGFESSGFAYVETLEELKLLPKTRKIVANVKDVEPVYGEDDPTSVVPLKALVEYALDYLSANAENGFTLMVEGAYIDKWSHSNAIGPMIANLMDLNDAVEYILDWASKRTDTSVIITADHETGGLRKGTNKESLSDDLYESDSHTASNVPLYLYNAKTESALLDNTEVFQIAKKIVIG